MEKYLAGFRKALKELNIQKGDIVYMASDVTLVLFKAQSEYNVKGKEASEEFLGKIIDILQETVSEEGTLLLPVFSWDFCRGKGFDYYKTKGEVGAINNWVLKKRKDFKRTKHPIYSFMVWGKYQDELVNMDNQDGWGEASPFYFFRTHHAKQLMFNVESYQGLTFSHYVEQCADVPYRHPKYFFGEYTDERGITEVRMYSMSVRDLDVDEGVGVHNEWLVQKGVAATVEWDECMLTIIDLEKSYDVLYNDMKDNQGRNSLRFNNYELDWSKAKTVPYEISKIPVKE